MRLDDLKNPRTKNYSRVKYFLIQIERVIKQLYYYLISILNINIFKNNKKRIFLGEYKDTRFIEFLFFSLTKEYIFVYSNKKGLANFIKKIGVFNFFKYCKQGKLEKEDVSFLIDTKINSKDKNIVSIDTDYFFLTDNNIKYSNVVPYYIYPKTYKKIYSQLNKYKNNQKEFKIIFSGSTNKEIYNRLNWFDINNNKLLNRTEIIDIIESVFFDRIQIIKEKKSLGKEIDKSKIILFKNEKKVNKKKALLSTEDHLEIISKSEFFLTAPGTEMPICHHFIEAIKFGSIPITNYGKLILPEISKDLYLHYSSKNELIECINRAFKMSNEEKIEKANKLKEVYEKEFSPVSFLDKFNKMSLPTKIYANNDHDSVRLRELRLDT